MPNISLIGPGAIGGLIAAWLCQDDKNHVTVCARTPMQRLELETPGGVIDANPAVLTSPKQGQVADWILVATKAYDSESAAAWFANLLGENTHVAILQNGVDHVERFSAYLPAERILPVVVDCPTERVTPEKIRQRGPGTLVVPESATGSAFTDLFARTELGATTNSDFLSIVWRKLCINAAGAINDHEAGGVLLGQIQKACAHLGLQRFAKFFEALFLGLAGQGAGTPTAPFGVCLIATFGRAGAGVRSHRQGDD